MKYTIRFDRVGRRAVSFSMPWPYHFPPSLEDVRSALLDARVLLSSSSVWLCPEAGTNERSGLVMAGVRAVGTFAIEEVTS